MIKVRPSNERGHADHGWLKSYHTFSFADYYDQAHMGFSHLRVINEDWIAAGQGFGTHPHRDMEIVTFIVSGALEHKDSMGHGEVLRAGEVQRMTAGYGVKHSEFNHSKSEPVHLLQIWLLPREKGLEPGYEQKSFADKLTIQGQTLLVSPDGRDGSLKINQDVEIYHLSDKESSQTIKLEPNETAWLQLISGSLSINGTQLTPGDGAAISDQVTLSIAVKDRAQALYFHMR